MKKKIVFLLTLLLSVLLVKGVSAVPKLQLYIDGAEYVGVDDNPYESESWVTTQNPFTLWVIGALPGSADYIKNVSIFFATNMSDTLSGSIIVTPLSVNDSDGSLIGVEGTPTTFTFPGDFVYGTPVYGDGTLATHGIYPTYYVTYNSSHDPRLSLFEKKYLVEDKVDGGTNLGQQYAYSVEVTGDLAANYVHMDAADHVVKTNGKENAVFAPFSHDATYVPEFTTIGSIIALLGAGLFAMKKRRR